MLAQEMVNLPQPVALYAPSNILHASVLENAREDESHVTVSIQLGRSVLRRTRNEKEQI